MSDAFSKLDVEAVRRLQGADRQPSLRDYLDLMRIPNVFTAMADVVMGFLFAQSVGWQWHARWDFWTLLALVAASSALYTAGMTLNDVFDAELDGRERPERPIPSGRVLFDAAQRLGWRLLFLGVILGACTVFFTGNLRAGATAALLAATIVLYDAWLKRTPLGPAAMGACRTLNIMLGMNAVDAPLHAEHWLVAGGIGVYIAGVTWFARRESQRSGRVQLTLSLAVMLSGIGMLSQLPRHSERLVELLQKEPERWYMLTGALGLLITWRCFRAVMDPVPSRVRAAVAHCILSLVMLDAICCFSVRGVAWACLIFAFFLPSALLGRWIKMT
jgi:4-hydroxybenzoate polyprenyltransferase